jgi:hypothetical protein
VAGGDANLLAGLAYSPDPSLPLVEGEARSLEHDPEKWQPVFGKDHAPAENVDHDPLQPNRIVV